MSQITAHDTDSSGVEHRRDRPDRHGGPPGNVGQCRPGLPTAAARPPVRGEHVSQAVTRARRAGRPRDLALDQRHQPFGRDHQTAGLVLGRAAVKLAVQLVELSLDPDARGPHEGRFEADELPQRIPVNPFHDRDELVIPTREQRDATRSAVSP